jgi:serine/threonine protein kinase
MPACRVCGLEVAEDQESCPSCGAVQEPVVEMSVAPDRPEPDDTAPEPAAEADIEPAHTDEVVENAPATTTAVTTSETDGKKPGLKPLPESELLSGRYKIIRKIGGGGMGAVYLAQDQNLGGVERAVKEMVQSSIEEEQQRKAIDDFRRESVILSTLDHPSIPTIYDYFFDESQGRFYLVMKYISGGDLAGRLRAAAGGRIDERTVTEWAIQVCEVLAYLHGLPSTIVYRDLKPSNIMLDGNTGRVMLIDFGIARAINAEQKGVTAVGTMGYAPPELFSGQVEPRSDIYSLGSTMFHLLTGADPQNNPLLIFDFQKNPRPRQINPQLSDQMEKILMRAVEYNADHRFSNAEEMRRVLVEHLENLKRGAVTYGVTETPAAVSLSNQTVFCGFCGQRIIATDLFCAFCGSKQPIAQQGVHAEIYRAPISGQVARTAKLVIEGTSELDAPIFALEKSENLVGRRDPMSNIFPEIDLSRYDPQTKISRRHARIWRDGDAFLVEDLGSSNGTMLLPVHNEVVRLQPHHPYMLGNGDRIKLGDTTLHFMKG